MQLTDKVYNSLKQDVFNAKYKPNTLIKEKEIAEKYNVSRLTAREALHRLCAEGHLISYPRSGYMISILSSEEISQIIRLRNVVEPLMVEIACTEASGEAIRSLRKHLHKADETDRSSEEALANNREFHLAIAEITGNKFLYSMMDDLLGTLSRMDFTITSSNTTWTDYHVAIVEALEARDVDKAKKLILQDISQY